MFAPKLCAHSYIRAVAMDGRFAELHRFCREGRYEELRYALYCEGDAKSFNNAAKHARARTKRGNTLLHEAAAYNQADIVQLLLLHGISPDLKTKGGLTSLHIAASKGYVGCVKALLEGQADLFFQDDSGQDAMMKAERSKSSGRTAVLGLLRSRTIISLTCNGALESLKELIQQSRRTGIHVCLEDLEEALLMAVQTENSEAIPILVEAGAERLDCALILAMQLENVAGIAYLVLFKAIITKDACALRSLLFPRDDDYGLRYFKQVQPFLRNVQKCNMCYLLKVSIRKGNFQATEHLLSTFGVSRLQQKVGWNNLDLGMLISSWVTFMLPWIVDLNLSFNQLKNVSPKLFAASQLQQLDLSHNMLETVQVEMLKMPRLKYLNLSHNQIEGLPENEKWGFQLISLDLSNNNLKYLPVGIMHSAVEILNLKQNKFTSFPLCVCHMDALRSLDISYTPITSLPKNLTLPKSLLWLNIRGTKIRGHAAGTLDREAIRNLFNTREYPVSEKLAELNQFCRKGLYNELRYTLYYEKDVFDPVRAGTQHGNTLLHEAAECYQADIIQLLLQHGASPNLRAKGGMTPLHVAAAKGHVGCVKALLEGNADVSLRDNIGHDAFMKAERSKKKEVIQRLLISKEVVSLAGKGDLKTLEKRLNAGPKNFELRDLEEALLTAIRNGNDDAVPLLIVSGARRLDCALYLAIQLERVKSVAMLRLYQATITGDCQSIHLLYKSPACVNMPWYMKDVHTYMAVMHNTKKISYPIAVSIMEKNYEATKELLLRTGLDMCDEQVDWSMLKLTLLHSSWMYSIAPWVVTLKLNNNHLRKLPEELFTASQLQRLDLSHNLLTTIQAAIFSMPNLEYLNLSHNQLKELPDTDNWSPQLLTLDLTKNHLQSLPTGIQLSTIETLNLSENKFTSFPLCVCHIYALRSLDISYTPITSLPKNPMFLKSLVWFNIRGTKIHGHVVGTLDGEAISSLFNIRDPSFEEFAVLNQFCRKGLYDELRHALYYEKDVLDQLKARTARGNTLLHEAAECNQADIIQLLLQHGASPNLRAKGGMTPLHVAAAKGHVDCVKALLEGYADVSLRDDIGHDALMKAEQSKNKEVIQRLLISKEVVSLAGKGDLKKMLEKRLNAGPKNFELWDLEEALLTAIRNGNDDAVPLLIVSGARRLDCALYLAIQLERVKSVAMLLLCQAAITGDCQSIRLLYEPPDCDMPWYMKDVHIYMADRHNTKKMNYPIVVSIMEKNYEATKELLLKTGLDMRRKQVDWSMLKLTLLHSSWMYSIAPWVVTLKLINNHLRKLPEELFTASQLRQLDLSLNLLTIIQAAIFGMPNLQYLNLSHNQLKELPDTDIWSPQLLTLDLTKNHLQSLPAGIQHSAIEILNLSENLFTTIPRCLCRIKSLTSLDLSHMSISSIPKEMENLGRLVNLNVSTQNLTIGVSEARARLNKPCNFVKVIILCQSDFAKEVMTSRLRGTSASTTSIFDIGIFQWSYRPLLKRLKLHFNTWLLGSSTDYSAMYPCFFTPNALYLIVWDMTRAGEMREQIKLYADLLARYVPNANILVMVILPEPFKAWADANCENLTKRLNGFFSKPIYSSLQYHGLVMMSTAAAARNTEINVKQKIYEIASTMTVNGQVVVGRCYPEDYFTLTSVVEKEQQVLRTRGMPGVLEENTLWNLFEHSLPNDSPDRMELPVIVDFLQDAGLLMHFSDPNDRLDQYYFLRPEWLYYTMLRVLRHALHHSECVTIGYTDLCSLANLNWSEHVSKALIRLMIRHAVVLPIKTQQQLLIPHLLPHCTPSSAHLHVGSLRRQFAPKTKALPSDLWYRIICRILASLHRITEMEVLQKASVSPSDRTMEESHEKERSALCLQPTFQDVTISHTMETESPHSEESMSLHSLHPPQPSASLPVLTPPPDTPASRDDLQICSTSLSSSIETTHTVGDPPTQMEGATSQTFSVQTESRPRVKRVRTVPPRRQIGTHSYPVMIEKGVQIWNCGLMFEKKDIFFSIYPCSCKISSVEEKGIEICSTKNTKGRIVLARLCKIIQNLLEERYPNLFSVDIPLYKHELTQFAICPICIEKKQRNPTNFLVETCVHSLRENECHHCRFHPETVPLLDLVPDYLIVDVPSTYNLSADSIQYNQAHPLHRSIASSLRDGKINGQEVAVKVHSYSDGRSFTGPLSNVRQEMEMLFHLKHPNIVRTFGFCLSPPCVLLEKAPLGNLQEKLMDTEQRVSRSIRFHIGCQVASALDYLHRKEIIYRTLKASSILVWSLDFCNEVNVKLTNFERAKFRTPSGLIGKPSFAAYHAPEMLRYSFQEEYTEKIDIYSFGMLLYELVTCWQPFGTLCTSEQVPVSQRLKVLSGVTAGYSTMAKLMRECWHEDQTMRPTALFLTRKLSHPAFVCHIATGVLRDCTSVRGCCYVPSVHQIWVYGEYNPKLIGDMSAEGRVGTQVFIMNAQTLAVQGSLELKERVTAIHTINNKVWIGTTEACVCAYDTTTFHFTDRLYLKDSVTAIADNETYALVAQANGVLTCYSKLKLPKESMRINIGSKPIISMIPVGDTIWLCCGNEIVILSADEESVKVEKRWTACDSNDQVYFLVLSKDVSTVWSLVRGGSTITSWDSNRGTLKFKTDFSQDLWVICCGLNYEPLFVRMSSMECVKDTLWVGLTCGAIVVLSATDIPKVITSFRAHQYATEWLMEVPRTDSSHDPTMILSGGYGEMSYISSPMTEKDGVIMSWQALPAKDFECIAFRYDKYYTKHPTK